MTVRFRGVIPELPVVDVDLALAYYRDTLGFSVEGRHTDEAGEAIFGSVLCGAANLYLSRSATPLSTVRCWVFADDVDTLSAAFESRGARLVEGVEDKSWGYRQFTVEDLYGHVLHFFQFSEP